MKKEFFITFLLCALPSISYSQSGVDTKQEKLKEFEQRIQDQKKQLKKIRSKEGNLHGELQSFDQKIDTLQGKIIRLRRESRELSKTIREKQKRSSELRVEIDLRKSSISKSLKTMHVWGEPTFLRMILTSESPFELRKRHYLVRRWMRQDEDKVNDFKNQVENLYQEEEALKAARKSRALTLSKLTRNEDLLVKERSERSDLLALVKNQRNYYESSIEELRKAAEDLQNLIETLRRSQSLEDSVFAKMRGRLLLPVRGKLEKKFGSYSDPKVQTKLHHKGIDLRTKAGEKVKAVFDGKVAYAGWFVGYGKILILDHGGGYFTLYAHLADILRDVGETVVVGDVVGKVGDTGSLKGAYLYFELRHKGLTQDPWPWFARAR